MSPARARAAARWLLLAACVLLWTAAFTVSHLPAERLPELPTTDVSLHAVGFFVLGTVLFWTLTAFGLGTLRRFVTAAVALAAYAALDEATQPLFRRYGTVSDWLADMVGAAAALAVCGLVMGVSRLLRRGRPG
jgi:VanZ family protein